MVAGKVQQSISITIILTIICNSAFEVLKLESILIHSYFVFNKIIYECSNLENVSFQEPSNLTAIEESTFERSTELKSISIPSSISEIVNKAFYNCSNLNNITFKKESNLTIIGNSSFYECSNLVIVELPHQIKEISLHSF